MFCKHCGMESTTPGVCSWCRHPLTAAASEPGARGPVDPQVEQPDLSQPGTVANQSTVSVPLVDQSDQDSAGVSAAPDPLTATQHTADSTQQRPIIGVRGRPQMRPVPPSGQSPVGAPVPRPAAPPQPLMRQAAPPIPRTAAPAQPAPAAPALPVTAPQPTAGPAVTFVPQSAPDPVVVTSYKSEPEIVNPATAAPAFASEDEDLPPLAAFAPTAPAPRAPAAPAVAEPAPPRVESAPGSHGVTQYQPTHTVPQPASAYHPAPAMPTAPTPPPPRQAPPVQQNQPVQQASLTPQALPYDFKATPAGASATAQPVEEAAAPQTRQSVSGSGRAYPPGRQPLSAEPEPEEVVGLASGMSASSRPSVPTAADMNLHAALSGSNGMVQSKYYSGQMVDTISGTQYDAASGTVTSAPPLPGQSATAPPIIFHWDEPTENVGPLFVKYLVSFLLVLTVGGLTAGLLPYAWVAPLALATFAGGMMLPVFRIIPWQDEDADDAVWLLLLLLVLGPAVGLVCYSVICLIRQDWNSSVLGCLGVALVTRVVMELCAQHGFSLSMVNVPWVQPPPAAIPDDSVSLQANIFISYTSLLAMAGWYVANVFHKADE